MNLDLFAGPGGWTVAAGELGLPEAGVELDPAACATRAAAGHVTIRADVTRYPTGHLPGTITGLIASPPCVVFSAAGKRAGVTVTHVLADAIADALAGRKTRAARRREAAAALRAAWWPDPKLTRAARSAAIWKAVRSAALVAEPARFIHAARPEWVALEQVPAVLPLWQVYAAGLRALGYSAWCGKLNAADYGVPQTRERAFLIASQVREVWRPEPTHYDPRKGGQLWGERWVSMAEALGWGATCRPGVTVTAGGTSTGGAMPFGNMGREALAREQDAGRWALRMGNQPGATVRPAPAPAPAIAFGHNAARMEWVLHTNRDQRPDGTRQTADPATAPALTAKSGGQWIVKGFRNNSNNNACERTVDEPAGTLGESHSSASVRITVAEAAALQSFPPGYPWQGTRTRQFEQVGNAVPPLLAIPVLGMAAGADWLPVAEVYAKGLYGGAGEGAA